MVDTKYKMMVEELSGSQNKRSEAYIHAYLHLCTTDGNGIYYGLVRNDPKYSPIHKKFPLYLWLE
jgi:hypothetical protein